MTLRTLFTLSGFALASIFIATTQAATSVPEPSLEPTAAMREFLKDQNITPNLPPLAKMQRILEGLYDSEKGFTYSARETLTAAQAFEAKRGNCVSFAMLFVTLARDAGLDARFNQIDYSPIWDEINGILVETSHINAVVYVGANQYVVESMPEYAEIATRSRKPISDERVFSHYYNNTGLIALANDDTVSAKQLIDTAISIDKTNGTAWQNLGLYHFRQSQTHEGETALLEASKRATQSSSVCFLLSQYYEKTGDKAKAKHFAQLGTSRSKKNPFFHYKKYQDALASGDLKKSIQHLEKAIQMLPQYTPFQRELANLHTSLNSGKGLAQK